MIFKYWPIISFFGFLISMVVALFCLLMESGFSFATYLIICMFFVMILIAICKFGDFIMEDF